MLRIAVFTAAALLAGCATTASQSAYTLGVALDTAEKAAAIYVAAPNASAATVAKLKSLDAQAYATIAPVVAAGGNATAQDIAAAQAALALFTAAMAQKGN